MLINPTPRTDKPDWVDSQLLNIKTAPCHLARGRSIFLLIKTRFCPRMLHFATLQIEIITPFAEHVNCKTVISDRTNRSIKRIWVIIYSQLHFYDKNVGKSRDSMNENPVPLFEWDPMV